MGRTSSVAVNRVERPMNPTDDVCHFGETFSNVPAIALTRIETPMHFIVTGGAGFIGSHVTELLLTEGHRVTVVDSFVTGKRQNLPEHPALTVVPKDIALCQVEDFGSTIDGIAHLAATPSVTESWVNPLAAHDNNLSNTLAVIKLCQTLRVPRLVFASSAAVYGNPQSLPIAETHPTLPISPYGLQKLVSEQYTSLFAQQWNFSFVGLRLFNVYGPRQAPNSQYSGVISIFTKALQEGRSITIYGDGSQTRDFVYVKDVAQAFVRGLTATLEPGSSHICNVGTGRVVSLLQLVTLLTNLFPEWAGEVLFEPARLGDIQHSQAAVTQIEATLNFSPGCSLQQGLESFVQSILPRRSMIGV